MVDHVVNLGQRLRLSVDAYNKFVGSLESRVVPQAKRFEQLEVISAAEERLGEPVVLTEFPRELLSAELLATSDSREEG
jgi:DNA recombination protein RmuC